MRPPITQTCPKLETTSADAALAALRALAESSPHWRSRLARLGVLRAHGRAIKLTGHPLAAQAVWRAVDGFAGRALARRPDLERVPATVQDILTAVAVSPVHVAVHEPSGHVLSEYLLRAHPKGLSARCSDRQERVITEAQFCTVFTLGLCSLTMRVLKPVGLEMAA